MRSIIWLSDPQLRTLHDSSELGEKLIVRSALEFLDARRNTKTVSIIDDATMAELDSALSDFDFPAEELGPVIVITADTVNVAVGWLRHRPWLSHVVNTTILMHPPLEDYIGQVAATLTSGRRPRLLDWLGPAFHARRVRLARASKRVERLERMADYFKSHGIGSRTIDSLRDVTEELLTNAFYDAPVAAGAIKRVISRTNDIALTDGGACDMVYGCLGELAIVRVRDPFGALTRDRLVDVLLRCARTDGKVEVDETMGGAGLGLWRIFLRASFVAVSVIQERHTEFLVGMGKRPPKGPRPFAFHLFFKERTGGTVRRWKLVDVDTSPFGVDKSVAIETK